jgi:hypothetical protein
MSTTRKSININCSALAGGLCDYSSLKKERKKKKTTLLETTMIAKIMNDRMKRQKWL